MECMVGVETLRDRHSILSIHDNRYTFEVFNARWHNSTLQDSPNVRGRMARYPVEQ